LSPLGSSTGGGERIVSFCSTRGVTGLITRDGKLSIPGERISGSFGLRGDSFTKALREASVKGLILKFLKLFLRSYSLEGFFVGVCFDGWNWVFDRCFRSGLFDGFGRSG